MLFVCTFLGKTGNGFFTHKHPVYLIIKLTVRLQSHTDSLSFWVWFALGQTQPGKLLQQDWRPLSQPSGIKKAPKPREDRGISVCVPVFEFD